MGKKKRFDGICPNCKEREKAVAKSGKLDSYCRQCKREKANERYARNNKRQRRADGICPKCKTNKREPRSKSETNRMLRPYCKICARKYGEQQRRKKGITKREIDPFNWDCQEMKLIFCIKKSDSKSRSLDFELSKSFFQETSKQNCFYCGNIPSNKYSKKYYNDFIYQGIDRIDSSLGYSPENCVPCCKTCNLAKSARSQKEYLDHCLKVVEFNRGK